MFIALVLTAVVIPFTGFHLIVQHLEKKLPHRWL
jgi:hypothetical protein